MSTRGVNLQLWDVEEVWHVDGLVIRVLGPLRVTRAGQPVELSGGRLRALLAVLAMSARRPISVDRLAAALWDEDPPDHIRRTVQTYLTRLRGALGPGTITTGPAGYVLQTAPDRVDALRFGRLLDTAGQLPDPAARRVALEEALGLWRGDPFEGVPSRWLARAEGPRLVERYLTAVEHHADLAVAAGQVEGLVAQLQALAAQHPLRESLWVRLLVLLARCGRQAEALERYEQIRLRLAEELGTGPGPELQRAHLDLLAGRSPRPAPGKPAVAEWQIVPRQLPADIDAFTGRAGALAALDSYLDDANATAVVVTAIAGAAGVGKTTLAVHWAHRVAGRFPDGQLYVDLRGFHSSGQSVTPQEAVRRLLSALAVPADRIPSDLDAQIGLYRSLLSGKRMLVVLDNARDAGQVRPLLPGSPGCLALVTSRNQLTSLVAADDAKPLTVDLFTADEARRLLVARLGADRVAAEPDAVDEIVARCAGLPLALAVVAARAALHPGTALAAAAAQLREGGSALDALADDDPTIDARRVFSWSYQALSPGAARMLRLIGLHPGPDLSRPAAASLAALPDCKVQPLLAELCHAHLLTEHAPGRYLCHDLLRAYAAELAARHDQDDVRRNAQQRLLDHYLHTGITAARLLNPHREPIMEGDPQPGVTTETIADGEQALGWFAAEQQVLLGGITYAAAAGLDSHAWQLAWTVRAFLHRRGYWHSLRSSQHTALAAAQRLGDQLGQAHSHKATALACLGLGQHADAGEHLQRALALYCRLGDLTSQAHCHINLGNLAARLEQHAEALHHGRRALELYVAGGSRTGEALALNGIGWSYAQLGDCQQALAHCQRALVLSQELADRTGEASTWDSIGYAHHQLGDYREALRCFRRALALFTEQGNRFLQAKAFTNLGETHRAAGELAQARRVWRQALTILAELDHPEVDHLRAKLISIGDVTE